MKRLILFVMILNSVLAVGQNQGNFSKLVVRDWIIYQGDTLAVLNVSGDTIFVDSGQTAPDTLILHNYWTKTTNDIANNNTGKVTINGDSLYLYPLPDEATKVGRIATLLSTGEVQWASPATLQDTLPGYWTFVDSATDTLKNNVATGGVVAVKGNLELQTTTATVGQIKQNGTPILHTYHEKGDNNLFIGQNAGNYTADSSWNVGIGTNSLFALTTGRANTSIGYYSMKSTNIGSYNISIGSNSMLNNNDGNYNVAIGTSALNNGITPYCNIAIGSNTLEATTVGGYNTSIGYQSMKSNIEGEKNTAIGTQSLYNNKDNDESVAIGYQAMYYADSRTSSERITYNTAIGNYAMLGSSTAANNIGQYNTALGYQSLYSMTSADSNAVIGVNALKLGTTASRSVIIGVHAADSITTGSGNIIIGNEAGGKLTTESNKLYIENSNSATPLIYGDFAADSVVINGDLEVTGNFIYEPPHFFIDYLVTGNDTVGGSSAGNDIVISTRYAWTKFALGFIDTETHGFTLIATDTLRYDGTKDAHIEFRGSINLTGGANEDWEIAVWNVTDNAIVPTRTTRTTTGAANLSGAAFLAYDVNADGGDKYCLKVRNMTNTGDLTVFYVTMLGSVLHFE